MPDMEKARAALDAFREIIEATPPHAAHARVAPDAWTPAEIVGHLIDSAANNHQRFVRLRFGDLRDFPGYDAEPWVAAQGYDACDFAVLAALWADLNALLLHLAATTPASALENAWIRAEDRPTLGFLIDDYYDHLLLHVEHYRTRLAEIAARSGAEGTASRGGAPCLSPRMPV